MIHFIFPAAIQAGLASGAYEVVRNAATGQALGIARDAATGQFVGHAVAGTLGSGAAAAPLFAVNPVLGTAAVGVQAATGAVNAYQGQKILGAVKTLQASVGVLQGMTAMIGVGVAVTAVLAAINLHQTLKLRQDVKQLRLEVQDGFFDLKRTMREQSSVVIDHINKVANDQNFARHRLELIKAYGQFSQALSSLRTVLAVQDTDVLRSDLSNIRQTLNEALANYKNPQLLEESKNSAYRLRRSECAWAIDQTIALTYQLQGQYAAAGDRLFHLQADIRRNCAEVAQECDLNTELDFIFPELTCIHDRDLATLSVWQDYLGWLNTLSPSEQAELASLPPAEAERSVDEEDVTVPEIDSYAELQQRSHPRALRDCLALMFSKNLRHDYETYIDREAHSVGYTALKPKNLAKLSDLGVANLYWYFQTQGSGLRSA